ncbi:hypothetical protein IscW_ISCW009255 [Ixodes scapularis]|uniref:Uncharacterized protein n=1 Tax=Ixodes scapularis TaxID=6945 RepID=B7Q1X4_IXOSC|nr:hypothetical protein IscW_ISCW009255 [Ixodes scapularis]|eukprot:XP_002410229.1 hypothetical protein IscW_ISCW009255 [Ixodes scapularis]
MGWGLGRPLWRCARLSGSSFPRCLFVHPSVLEGDPTEWPRREGSCPKARHQRVQENAASSSLSERVFSSFLFLLEKERVYKKSKKEGKKVRHFTWCVFSEVYRVCNTAHIVVSRFIL